MGISPALYLAGLSAFGEEGMWTPWNMQILTLHEELLISGVHHAFAGKLRSLFDTCVTLPQGVNIQSSGDYP